MNIKNRGIFVICAILLYVPMIFFPMPASHVYLNYLKLIPKVQSHLMAGKIVHFII